MDIKPINTTRIYQHVIGQLVGLLRAGKLKAGDRCPSERTLAALFEVSRASVREALRAMEVIGLIEVRHGDGAFITDLNMAPFLNAVMPLLVTDDGALDEMLDFRSMLEREAVSLVAGRCDPTGLARLDAHLDAMARALADANPTAGAEADIGFHKELFALSGNSVLRRTAECISYMLESSVRLNRARILQQGEHAALLLEQHRQIRDLTAAGRAAEAAACMEAHLVFVRHVV